VSKERQIYPGGIIRVSDFFSRIDLTLLGRKKTIERCQEIKFKEVLKKRE